MNEKTDQLLKSLKYDNGFEFFIKDSAKLIHMTDGCRGSMHEPDENDVSATIKDGLFDNAGGGGEMELTIWKGNFAGKFNMASLVALARIGAQYLLENV